MGVQWCGQQVGGINVLTLTHTYTTVFSVVKIKDGGLMGLTQKEQSADNKGRFPLILRSS